MNTKRFWGPAFERRSLQRMPADFYGVELSGGGRYLRKICNVSPDGVLFESPFASEHPGQLVELELPRLGDEPPRKLTGKVVYVGPRGRVGLRRLDASEPLEVEELGGRVAL